MIQQVQNSCQFYGLPGDDANKHLDKFLHVTQSIKVNGFTDDALRLYLFPHSLTHHATAWFDRLCRNSINSFEQMAKMFLGKYFSPSMVTKLRNEITNFSQCPDESLFEAWEPLKAKMAEINKNLMRVLQVNQQVKAVAPNCKTCGDPHSFSDCPATVGNTQNVYAAGAYQECDTKATKDTVHPTNKGSTEDVQPPVVPTESLILNFEPVNSPIIELVAPPANLNFNISFADALILMPKFGPSIKSLLTNKDKLCELARTPLNEHYSENKLSLPDLSLTCMTLKLANRSISHPVGVAEDVFVKVANYNDMTANRIDIFDMACEEYSKEVLDFSDVIASGNPTPYYDLIVSTTSSTVTPFENSEFFLEEVDAFLALEDDPTSPKVDQSYVDTKGDILLLEAFLDDDPSLPLPIKEITCLKLCNTPDTFQRCMMAIFHDMIKKTMEVFMDDFSVFGNSFQTCLSHLEKMLKRCEDTNLCLN
uniref:Reverse transcriptase domain-containing protein n=1 Tax=Tanacetum cinerariifolium TaxID=118510 RepID=A0A6L2JVM0_TANCI|nr:reverse transcriptase domain-containing protein [Tanacetum cinerariifolium]